MYSNVDFFKNKETSFSAWIALLTKPNSFGDQEYIYKEGEEISEGMSPVGVIIAL
jgi:hypothetical protein